MKTSKDYLRELEDIRKSMENDSELQKKAAESKADKPGFFEGMGGCVSFIFVAAEFLLLVKMIGLVFMNTEGAALYSALAVGGSLFILMLNNELYYLIWALIKKIVCREPVEAVCLNGYFTDEERAYKNDYLRPEEMQFEIEFHGEKRVIKSDYNYNMIYERNTSHILMINPRKPEKCYDPEAIKVGVAITLKEIGVKALQSLLLFAVIFVIVYTASGKII